MRTQALPRPGHPPRRRLIPALLLLLAGCGGETGILVAVSGKSVDELEFHVALEQKGSYLLDEAASGQRYDVRGRNLGVDPYEHLLREEGGGGTQPRVLVLVLGRSDGKITSFAVTDPPQPFVSEEVVRRSLSLREPGSYGGVSVRSTGCFRAWQKHDGKTSSFVLAVEGDLDCDGSKAPADCEDDDFSVHPGATEVCDGKDNNCDGKLAESQVCYATEAGACRKGSRLCNEAQGGGLSATCTVLATDPAVPGAYCAAYADCKDASDPVSCTEDKVGSPVEATCTAELDSGAGTLCGGSVQLEPLASATSCRWDLFDKGGWDLGLSDGTGGEPLDSVTVCKPKLVLRAGSAKGFAAVVLEFSGGGGGPKLGQLSITAKPVTACSQEPFVCTFKQ